MNGASVRILLVDDDEDDVLITRELLAEVPGRYYDVEWMSTFDTGLEVIRRNTYDVCLLDYRLPGGTGLEFIRESGTGIGCDTPIILLTGQGDQAIDEEAMRAGAADYLVKRQIGAPLLERSIRYAINHTRVLRELRQALAHVEQLQGIIPICMHCKRIRGDQDTWQRLETYIESHSGQSEESLPTGSRVQTENERPEPRAVPSPLGRGWGRGYHGSRPYGRPHPPRPAVGTTSPGGRG